jgi:hypothetical protein
MTLVVRLRRKYPGILESGIFWLLKIEEGQTQPIDELKASFARHDRSSASL